MTSGEPAVQARPSLPSRVAQVVLGPWPLRPAMLWVMTVIVLQYSSSSVVMVNGASPFNASRDIPANLFFATVLAAPLWAMKVLHRRVTGVDALSRPGYLLALLVTGLWAAITRFATTGARLPEDGQELVYYVIRSVIFIVVLHATLGVSDARLRRQVRRADEATALVMSQRTAVVEAEERARRSVAQFLHDRVQAGLVALMLQLRLAQQQADGDTSARLSSVIDDMERMRVEDVRFASRQLSPDLEVSGLSHALDDLAGTYRPAIASTIEVDVDSGAWDRLRTDASSARLGVYRIVEQALLNAAAHGHASQTGVRVVVVEDTLLVRITDDGVGLPEGVLPRGSGSAVIDAWVGSLEGSWSLRRENGTTVLEVRAPLR